MDYTKQIKEIVGEKRSVVTMGFFDGVHRGHQYILNNVKKEAQKTNSQSVVVSFNPHPRIVLSGVKDDFKLINSLTERVELIKSFGIDKVVIIPFTKELANLTSFEYLEKILTKYINIDTLLVGYDHGFGSDKIKDTAILKKYGDQLGFKTKRLDFFSFNQKSLSSSEIRKKILEGKISECNKLLGHIFSIGGEVIKGKQIGNTIGFPTANIKVSPDKILPKSGVYAVVIEYNDLRYKGMMNIGINPTISGNNPISTEVNIFNFNKHIYGQSITINVYDRIRDEKKFSSVEDLKEQLIKDKSATQITLESFIYSNEL